MASDGEHGRALSGPVIVTYMVADKDAPATLPTNSPLRAIVRFPQLLDGLAVLRQRRLGRFQVERDVPQLGVVREGGNYSLYSPVLIVICIIN